MAHYCSMLRFGFSNGLFFKSKFKQPKERFSNQRNGSATKGTAQQPQERLSNHRNGSATTGTAQQPKERLSSQRNGSTYVFSLLAIKTAT
ncbi:hypothetical protein Bpfe_023707 [Biomphalaria pfeifferi]|uniref:Uncharacterized protein n=1 Tax=Biomphalaria pfeifferi TaxID=112525 RepID=A0AAD8B2F0_BIOPF|nr:hypothetical protein Bpfe_023707 [Biomphalaria pfeifferi]